MFKIYNDKYCEFITYDKDNNEVLDPFANDFCMYLKKNKGYKPNTIKKYIRGVHRFWMYAFHYPPSINENFANYVADYVAIVKNEGFVVNLDFDDLKVEYFKSDTVKDMGQDLKALEIYFGYLISYSNTYNVNSVPKSLAKSFYIGKDILGVDRRLKESIHSSYGMRVSPLMKEAMGRSKTLISELINTEKRMQKRNTSESAIGEALPLKAYFALLEYFKDKPRERLFCLVCGGLSARRGQALSMTWYDVDEVNKRVYLTDPFSQSRPKGPDGVYLEQKERSVLLEEVFKDSGIDYVNMLRKKEIGFKHPIPLRTLDNRTLTFLLPELEDMFFETYSILRNECNLNFPFVFQTKPSDDTTGILGGSEIAGSISNALKYLSDTHPELDIKENLQPIHSMRHMYGTLMCGFGVVASVDGCGFVQDRHSGEHYEIFDFFRKIAKHRMGIASDKIDCYFNYRDEVKRYTDKYVVDVVKNVAMDIVSKDNKELSWQE
jgi:hypothetical protein